MSDCHPILQAFFWSVWALNLLSHCPAPPGPSSCPVTYTCHRRLPLLLLPTHQQLFSSHGLCHQIPNWLSWKSSPLFPALLSIPQPNSPGQTIGALFSFSLQCFLPQDTYVHQRDFLSSCRPYENVLVHCWKQTGDREKAPGLAYLPPQASIPHPGLWSSFNCWGDLNWLLN